MLGAGFIGTFHSYALRLQSLIKQAPQADLRLKVIADRDQQARQMLIDRFGWKTGVGDWQEVLARRHRRLRQCRAQRPACAAVDRRAQGRQAVFCEKPLAMDAAEAFEMWQRPRRPSAINQAAFVYRFVPALRHARDLIRGGAIGEVTHFRSEYLMSNYLQPDLDFSWRLDKKIAGTGTFGDLGAHHIDLARFLVGEISEVAAIGRTVVPQVAGKRSRSTTLSSRCCSSNPARSGQSKRRAWRRSRTYVARSRSTAPRGSIRYDVARLNELEIAEGLASGFRTIQVIKEEHPFADFWWEGGVQGSHPIGWVECFVQQMNHFIEAVLGSHAVSPLAATFEDGYRAVGDRRHHDPLLAKRPPGAGQLPFALSFTAQYRANSGRKP